MYARVFSQQQGVRGIGKQVAKAGMYPNPTTSFGNGNGRMHMNSMAQGNLTAGAGFV